MLVLFLDVVLLGWFVLGCFLVLALGCSCRCYPYDGVNLDDVLKLLNLVMSRHPVDSVQPPSKFHSI